MQELSVWSVAADRLSQEVLERGGYVGGAVDLFPIARQRGCTVVYDQSQAGRGRLKRIAGRSTIFLRPDGRPERLQWALAHEIGETLAHELFARVDVDPAEVGPGVREQAANLLASRLLLPRAEFRRAVQFHGEDLKALKQHFPTASHELIAFRLLDFPQPGWVTIFDQGRMTRRRGDGIRSPGLLTDGERDCWQQTHRTGDFQASQDGHTVRKCWPVHEADWKREILLTRPQHGSELIADDAE